MTSQGHNFITVVEITFGNKVELREVIVGWGLSCDEINRNR